MSQNPGTPQVNGAQGDDEISNAPQKDPPPIEDLLGMPVAAAQPPAAAAVAAPPPVMLHVACCMSHVTQPPAVAAPPSVMLHAAGCMLHA